MVENKILQQLESGKIGTEKQIKEQKEAIERHKALYKLNCDKFKLEEEITKLACEKPKALNPTHEFQTDDKYWDLEAQIRKINFEVAKLNHESSLKNLQSTIDNQEKELERLQGDKNE